MLHRPSALLVTATLLAACGTASPEVTPTGAEAGTSAEVDPDAEADTSAAAPEATLRVVATVAPVADLVAAVGGDRVEVWPLVPAGVDSHSYEPRPSDVGALEDADLYLGIGLGLNDAALALADASVREGVPVLRLGEEVLGDAQLVFDHTHGDGEVPHTHGDDEVPHTHGDDEVPHTHGDDEVPHTHGDGDEPGPNPHVWTSVRGAVDLVDGIAEALAAADPDGADGYRERADAYATELLELDAAIAEAAATIPDDARTLVTFHDAWTYFARDHDLEFATAVQPADHTEPSASEVRAVIDLVRELDVPAVFGSEVFPSRVLEAIASETDATYVGDLADDVLPGQPGDPEHSYLGMMRRNATTIVEALGGDAAALR